MEDFTTRKSSNEYRFSVAVTSLNKIGEERIRNHTGNVLLLMIFKYNMLVAVTFLNKISEGRIRDHTGASCLTLSECEPIMLQGGSKLTKPIFVFVLQIPLALFDTISKEKL